MGITKAGWDWRRVGRGPTIEPTVNKTLGKLQADQLADSRLNERPLTVSLWSGGAREELLVASCLAVRLWRGSFLALGNGSQLVLSHP